MMNQTELYIKNIIKIKNLFLILLLGVLYTQDYTNDRIDKKQKSLNNIDSEINSLEKKLTNEIESLQSSKQTSAYLRQCGLQHGKPFVQTRKRFW